MKIAIIGYAGQGRAAYEHWDTDDNHLTICDKSTDVQVPSGVEGRLGEDYLSELDDFDLIVRTPILHPQQIIDANPQSPNILDKVTTVTNEFFKSSPSKNIIGVTGTKGKGTTSTLITRILESAGHRVHLGGNIGIPPLDLLKDDIQSSDWVVLELANFQLIDLKYSPPIAVCLMITPEHLDWHKDMEEYITAKQQLFARQKDQDIAIYYSKNDISKRIASVSRGRSIPFLERPGAVVEDDIIQIDGKKICRTAELKLVGKHNWQNVCAAVTAVWQITQDVPAIRKAVINFSGLPHRIEKVREVDGVAFYNDSFATGQGATIAAIEAIQVPKVMILGGYDRMLDLAELAKAIVANQASIRKILLIGASADRTAEVLDAHGFKNYVKTKSHTMPEIVADAQKLAKGGDAVVLSPGFASFDMFKNFEERGNLYKAAVEGL